MKPLNAAQRLLASIGVDPVILMVGHVGPRKMPHFTKSGPGRRHQQGKKKTARGEQA